MNVLGISPGITRLSYCVLSPGPSIVDCDTLKGAKLGVAAIAALGLSELSRKFRVHDLILSVIWERYEPTKIVIGPASDKEHPMLVKIAQEALREMALQCSMEVDEYLSDEALASKFDTTPKRIRSAVEGVGISCVNRNKATVFAMAAAATHFYQAKKDSESVCGEIKELSNVAVNDAQGILFT